MPKLINAISGLTFLTIISFLIMVSGTFAQPTVKTLNPPQKLKGLNAPVVLSVIKDANGFMWFFTAYGLVRYDGYNFKTYYNDPGDSTSMPGISGISTMIEGPDGKIWIGTSQNMLVEFNPVTEVFTSYLMDSTISDNYRDWISTMYFDQSGILWIGLQYEGFYKFNPQEKSFKLYRQQTEKPIHNKDFVMSFLELDDKLLLTGTKEGLYLLDRQSDSIRPFALAADLPEGFDKVGFSCLLKDRNSNVWMGSYMGLFRFNPATAEMVQFTHDPGNENSLWGNGIDEIIPNPIDDGQTLWVVAWTDVNKSEINKIDIRSGLVSRYHKTRQETPINVYDYYMDESGLLWMASDNQGVFFIDMKDNPFHHFIVSTDNSGDEKFSGTAFYTDSRRDFWVGTGTGGLFQYDAAGNLKHRFTNLPGSLYNIPTLVYSIFEDSKNNLWISYWSDGVYRYNRKTGKFKRYDMQYPEADLPMSMSAEILEDAFGRLWVGSMAGPFFTEVDQEVVDKLNWLDFPALRHSLVRSLCQDKSGAIWVTSGRDGLFCLTPENRDSLQFINYRQNPDKPGSISSNIVFSVYCSHDGTIWVGTANGLNRFKPESKTFDYFSMDNGFDAYFVYCLRTDGSGNVWATTEKGLVRFNPDAEEGKKFKLFTVRDGLPFDKIYPYHFDKGKDGKFYMGGERGFGLGYFTFHPDSIKNNKLIPPVAITGFKVRNEDFPLDTTIAYKKNISLRYDQNFISFEFASLDHNDPEKNRYAYKLEGVDDGWIYSGNRRFASYTGLSPGNYVFRVKGSNNDGYWNEAGTGIAFTIATPPWKTGWAYAIYVVFAVGILLTIIRYYLRRQHLLHRLELEHLEADKLKEVDSMKSRFFANISHEFRTPLTLILGPLNKLLESATKEKEKKELTVMQRNARRLQQLINQLLDLSKLEAGKMQLHCREMNIADWVRMYIQSFESLARQRKIDFVFESEQAEIICFFDAEKMAQVFNNLLSNAFKFTGSGGRIVVRITPLNPPSRGDLPPTGQNKERPQTPPLSKGPGGIPVGGIQLTISDTGTGIPPEKLPHIFDRFYQADDSQSRKHEGTGIGLALVKELVELHHGSITVESTEGKGTTFTIVLPLGKEHLKPGEIVSKQPETVQTEKPSGLQEQEATVETTEETAEAGLPILLIVEDNADMRNYIRGFFTDDYKILETVNGQKGLEQAVVHIPDIIISDVMMPEMDGYEMCQKIKADQRTSHIPLILLTARSSGADKIEGMETGADDFVIKPFEGTELQVRVKNLVEQRERLREHFRKEFSFAEPLSGSGLPSIDQQFLRKALKIIEIHLSEPDFSVEDFSGQMAMSRVQLHRKMKAVTGLAPGDFIRSFRLKKAAEMLESKNDNITQIAFAVGFNNPSWFAECFKKQFGRLPSEYSRAHPDL